MQHHHELPVEGGEQHAMTTVLGKQGFLLLLPRAGRSGWEYDKTGRKHARRTTSNFFMIMA